MFPLAYLFDVAAVVVAVAVAVDVDEAAKQRLWLKNMIVYSYLTT